MTGLLKDHLFNRDNLAAGWTVPGQAHFADLSLGKRCSDCSYFAKGRCKKAAELANRTMPQFRDEAFACKYFVSKP